MKRFETKVEVINPKSSYFGKVGTFLSERCGWYRVEFIVSNSKGIMGPTDWYFDPSDVREVK